MLSVLTPRRAAIVALALVIFVVGAGTPAADSFDGDIAGKSVVRVTAGGGWGTGFIINDRGYVITNWHVVHDRDTGGYEDDIGVILNNTRETIPVELVYASSQMDFAILRAGSGLPRPPVALASVAPKPGGAVYLVGYPGVAISSMGSPNVASTSSGVLSRVIPGSWGRGGSFPLIQHSSAANPGNSGGPLFDGCGRVVGIHTASPKVRVKEGNRIVPVPRGAGIFFASQVSIVMPELRRRSIPFEEKTDQCLPATGGTEDIEAREKAEQARREAAKAKAEAERNRLETETAKQRAGAAEEQVRSITQQLLIWGPILVLFMAVTFVLALRKPRQQVIRMGKEYSRRLSRRIERSRDGISRRLSRSRYRPREEAGAEIDYGLLLAGVDREGVAVQIEIPARALSRRKGAVIGRAPEMADCVIDRSGISRAHARVTIAGRRLLIEDLASTNGTDVNGRRLRPHQPSEMRVGDRINFGRMRLKVSRL